MAAGSGPLAPLAVLSGQWHAAVDADHGREDVSAARLALAAASNRAEARLRMLPSPPVR